MGALCCLHARVTVHPEPRPEPRPEPDPEPRPEPRPEPDQALVEANLERLEREEREVAEGKVRRASDIEGDVRSSSTSQGEEAEENSPRDAAARRFVGDERGDPRPRERRRSRREAR